MRDVRTHKEKQKSIELGEKHKKLSWFYVDQPYQCTLINLNRGWYQIIGTRVTSKESWLERIKHKSTGDVFTISHFDYMKIINTFRDKNKHLI